MNHQIEHYVPSRWDRYYGRAYWKTPSWKRYGRYPYWDFYRRTQPTTIIVKDDNTTTPSPSPQPSDMYESVFTKNMLLMMMSLIMVVLLITIIVLYTR